MLVCPGAEKDLLVAELWERGTSGIVERDLAGGGVELRAFFDQPFDASEWAARGARWEAAEDRDWVAAGQAQWEPLPVGERFYLVPEWRQDPTPPGRIRVEMQPRGAYGTGLGEPTQLALEGLERCWRPDATVLDLGTGSGILAVAAARLGARRVFACDIDPGAACVARERFETEGIAVGVFQGSIRSIRPGSIDLLLANVNAETLTSLAPEIEAALTPGAAAVLSGFPAHHVARVRDAFGRGEVLAKGEWRALVW